MNRRHLFLFAISLFLIAGCDQVFRPVWHVVTLRSGAVVKVTAMNLV